MKSSINKNALPVKQTQNQAHEALVGVTRSTAAADQNDAWLGESI